MPDQMTTSVTASAETSRAPQALTVVQPPAAMPWDKAVLVVGGLAAAVLAIAALVALFHKALTSDLRRDVANLEHKVKNQTGRIDGLEHLRTNDIERIVRLETVWSNAEKALERIEHGQRENFAQLSQSIREIRVVAPRA